MTKKIDLPLILLAIAGFLAPLLGGKVAVDTLPLERGSSFLTAGLQGASETPTLSHAILAALCAAALVFMLLQRKIMQVPNNAVGGLLAVLLGLVVMSIGISSFRSVSIPAGMEWVSYGICFYAVVAAGGRQKGPMILLGSIFAGCVVLAILGIQEYGGNKATDPTWRIFPQWMGPNAMAAILVVGFFLGLALAINEKRSTSIVIALGCLAIGLALFLTQSKGSLLAWLIGLVVFAVMLVLWLPKKEISRAAGLAAGTVGAVLLLAVALTMQPKTIPGSGATISPGSRILNAGAEADQSVGFRKLLWQSAVRLIEHNPLGSGIGTFQYESTKPGLTTQTHFAHQTYLQLAVEASVLAPMLLIVALVLWTRLIFRGGSRLQSSQNVLRASVFASILALGIHSFIDSDLSYYGIGLITFMLLGAGLLLSSDAVAPEFLPAGFRRGAAGGVALMAALLLYLGYVEGARATARGSVDAHVFDEASAGLASLRSLAPWDSEVWYLSAQVSQEPNQRLEYAQKAVDLGPSGRNLRLLARTESELGKASDAMGAMERAAEVDPNNLQTLTLLSQIQTLLGKDDDAKKTLHRLIEVENTSYFKIKSLPELVATDTYEARIKLAAAEKDPKAKIELLQPAVDGFKQYLALTIPNVIRFAKISDTLTYGGESVRVAKQKLADGESAAKVLADAYRTVGDGGKAALADGDAATFAKPLDLPSVK